MPYVMNDQTVGATIETFRYKLIETLINGDGKGIVLEYAERTEDAARQTALIHIQFPQVVSIAVIDRTSNQVLFGYARWDSPKTL